MGGRGFSDRKACTILRSACTTLPKRRMTRKIWSPSPFKTPLILRTEDLFLTLGAASHRVFFFLVPQRTRGETSRLQKTSLGTTISVNSSPLSCANPLSLQHAGSGQECARHSIAKDGS